VSCLLQPQNHFYPRVLNAQIHVSALNAGGLMLSMCHALGFLGSKRCFITP
jgi:hypothetical protein